MALPRLAPDGSGFTVSAWNALIDALESLGSIVLGFGVLSGLELSFTAGLVLSVTDGTISGKNVLALASITPISVPTNQTSWIWINADGVSPLQTTTTFNPPTSNHVCLGTVTANGTDITATSHKNRQEFLAYLVGVAQVGGYVSVGVAGLASKTLGTSEYKCRIIELTGLLTQNLSVVVPLVAGYEWKFVNSTTGAFTVTIIGATGTGQQITQGSSARTWTDGVNLRL